MWFDVPAFATTVSEKIMSARRHAIMTTVCKISRRAGHAASQLATTSLYMFPHRLSIRFDVLALVATANERVIEDGL